jgi:hypothetical protein
VTFICRAIVAAVIATKPSAKSDSIIDCGWKSRTVFDKFLDPRQHIYLIAVTNDFLSLQDVTCE